jgi:hypothetical protein
MNKAVAIALLGVTTLAVAEDKKYTMADLKALVAQKSYREAVQHLEDISPSERNADWQDMAGTASAGLVAAVEHDEKLGTMQGLEARYPILLKSSKYLAARSEAGPPAFAECFQSEYQVEECRNAALKFVDADPANAKLTLVMAKVARLGMMSYAAMPFFKRAVAANKGGAACKDEDLSIAVIAALGLPYDNVLFVDAKPIAGITCWADLRKPILKELAANDSGYYKTNVCDLMRGKPTKETGDLTTLCAPKKE